MDASFQLWLEYLLRFAHLVAGIAWIGSSFYFIWMDSNFSAPETPRRNVDGELFMVHGGFYYQVEKRKIYPGELPKVLHWFKWEATLTWITGFLLLIVVYYLKGASLLIHPNPGLGFSQLTQWQAVGLSLAIVVGAWLIYDFIWNPRVFRSKPLSVVLSLPLLIGLIYLNTLLFSGRGAYIQTGAVLGTLMLLNVWIRILPGQTQMLKEAQAGRVPDYSVSLKSKNRSVHNTYFIFPVLFIMLSNHYPLIYNHPQSALLLILLSLSGALVRHAMVTRSATERWVLMPAAVLLGLLVYLSAIKPTLTDATSQFTLSDPPVSFENVKPIFQSRCVSCHSQSPSDDVFKITPKGLILETEAQIRSVAELIHQQVVLTQTMPLGNKTQMTHAERALIDQWLRHRK